MQRLASPYIGVTGFREQTSVGALVEALELEFSQEDLMVGVLQSSATLRGRPPRNPANMPPLSRVRDAFLPHPKTVNLVHYYTSGRLRASDLDMLVDAAGPNCHGLQLNVAWPEAAVLRRWRENHPRHRLVVQINRRAFREVQRSPSALCRRLVDYEELATHVLFDLSGGKGRRFDVELATQVLGEIRATFASQFSLAVAGGLGPGSLLPLAPLLRKHPALSVDAQSGLTAEGGQLDLEKCVVYFREAQDLRRRSAYETRA